VGIHVTTIRHIEFRKYEEPGPKLVDIMGYLSFFLYQKRIYVSS